MGVPAFFRWLSRKYPSVIIECNENKNYDDQGKIIFEDATLPNPNGVEFDNLYLDMNGIIHPCTHPEDKPPPKNEDEMMVAIFECIDRIFNIVRPRKLLYMAIDGVAPRAKMNQQRSRRFRAAKESVEKQLQMKKIREELTARGCILPPEKPKEEHFDSNCITPGTPFMDRLSRCLHYYVHDRLNNHPAWKNIKVILSDANVPGEGEHKIMDYIRKQRSQPDHDPNTQHVLCGADADLIMLGLATHEPNFTIIREEFLPNKPKPCEICGQFGHEMDKCQGLNAIDMNSGVKPDIPLTGEVKYIFVRLSVLREYLKRALVMPNLPFPYDFERAVDDWVFMCFFVGNDFLPHLPSLEIREGAIDRLIELYKKCAYKTKGYLTNSGEVDLQRIQMIMTDLGMVEDEIFKERQRKEEQFKAREQAKKRRLNTNHPNFSRFNNSVFGPTALGRAPTAVNNARNEIANFRAGEMRLEGISHAEQLKAVRDSKGALEEMMRPQNADSNRGRKRKADQIAGEEKPEPEEEEDYQDNDEVRLWEDGFKDRYYESKFDVTPENLGFRYSVALQYVRGLCWVLKYYYQGCASWNWYFPYHYAPFASDFVNIAGLSTAFEKGAPFNPMEQLMGVFPAASSSHIPEPWAVLMSDPKSTIIDFYPEDFKIDLNGKKFAWQGVALLPFVDEKRLYKALKPLQDKLTPEEKKRNTRGDNRLYAGPENLGYKFLKAQYKNKISPETEVPISIQGMRGTILLADDNVEMNGSLQSPINGLHDVEDNQVITVKYRDPAYPDEFVFPAQRLPKAIDPPTVLAPENRDGNYRHFGTVSIASGGHRMIKSQLNRGFGANFNNMESMSLDANARNSQNTQHLFEPPYSSNSGEGYKPYGNNNANSGNNRWQTNNNVRQNSDGNWGPIHPNAYGRASTYAQHRYQQMNRNPSTSNNNYRNQQQRNNPNYSQSRNYQQHGGNNNNNNTNRNNNNNSNANYRKY